MKFLKRLLRWFLALAILGVLLFALRVPIMKGIGGVLISEDTPQPVDAIFVLSGLSLERAPLAAEYWREGLSERIVAVGSNVNPALAGIGNPIPDAQLSAKILLDLGVDTTDVFILEQGSSTWEESEAILGYANREDLHKVMIISSKFHTRRIRSVFFQKFKSDGIDVVVVGADPLDYDIDRWWEFETSLIFVNNEYIKMLYYWIKY
ncbi:YdcF family protein [Pontibacter sp. G13]|uniref:YdcF family protein n=1 Tax=Pontibacter sp. G13 TaxID=3074898 RepID=UPI00288905FC|nr:YdcF family protein [Pontibacter sp. G13]WNJ18836.1 YdcF family protein [Pontibacter sp. G13]